MKRKLKKYVYNVLQLSFNIESLKYFFTITDNTSPLLTHNPIDIYRFHLQEIFQRAQFDCQRDGFSLIIMDDMNPEIIKVIKNACYRMTMEGDFVKYYNVNKSILTDNSTQSAGIQLADIAAGVFNSFAKSRILQKQGYSFALYLYSNFIKPKLRAAENGKVWGYGIKNIPSTISKDKFKLFNE